MMKKINNILWGLVFIVLGLIFGLNALDITDIDIFFDGWWTLLIIVPCFIGLFKGNDRTGDFIGLLIGIVLLLSCLNIIDFDIVYKLIFPFVLVVIGLSFIFKDFFNTKINSKIKELNKNNNSEEYSAMFSGQNLNFDNQEFKGASLNSIFGGIKLDLRKAKIDTDIIINLTTVFGGVDILVPSDVNVIVKSTSIFGGVDNKVQNTDDNKNTIYVNASCIFGGADIK